jgi:CTP:molybdopterin cytidylyltransferase MocA
VVNVLTREITDNLTSLVKQLDKIVVANSSKKMAAFVVHLTDDPDASEATLKALAKKHKIKKTPLTNFDGLAGPPVYNIAKDADVTVMMWVGGTVKVNIVLKKGELTKKKIKEIVANTSKILN